MELLLLVSLICGGLLVALVHRPHRNPHIPPHDAALRDTLAEPVPASAPQDRPRQTVLHGSAYVVDGDTLVIRNTRIRLFGVDAPEMQHPFGQKAKWALVSLCKGKTVRAEVIEEDSHGRIVARCFLEDGRDLSAEMVRLGLALDWPKFSGGTYRAMEVPGIRRKLWLADARQAGRMHVWERFETRRGVGSGTDRPGPGHSG